MLTFLRLSLFLAAFSALVSSATVSSLTVPTVYNNCSGKDPNPLPTTLESAATYGPQVRVNPLKVGKNGTGWEEWLFAAHDLLPDGSELIYGYKWVLGDPTSANITHYAFIAWAYFPNGTYYREIIHGDTWEYEEKADGGFSFSLEGNSLTYDATNAFWNVSMNANGYIINSWTQNVAPSIPYTPNYKGVPGQISEGFYSKIDVPRAHTQGQVIFPWGLNYTLVSVGSLKHTWSNEIMADAISAYVRGTIFLPGTPPFPIATLNFYQAWDNSGKEVDSFQYMDQPDSNLETQVFRLQITDEPDSLSIVTTPKPVSLPLSYEGTELTFPLCGPGGDSSKKTVWKVNNMFNFDDFIDFANGHTLYQRVNSTATIWWNNTATELVNLGIGIVEIYHR